LIALRADMCSARRYVRFTPESDVKYDIMECPLRPEADQVRRSERTLFDPIIGESARVLAPPIAHGTDDRA